MRCCLPIVRCCCVTLVFGSTIAWSQEQLGTKEDLTKAFTKDSPRLTKLFSGEEQATNADKKLADAAAQWYIYRITHLTWPMLTHEKVQGDFNSLANTSATRNNRAFINLFGPALVASMKEVLSANKTYPTTVVHAGMMFPTMARFKQDNISDYLVGLAQDDKTDDVTRLFALKALRELLPVDALDEESDLDKKTLAKKARDIKHIETLTKYIERPVKADGMHPEEVAAVRFLRREAIIALANAEAPAVAALKKVGKVEGAVAPALLRVLANNLEPTPSLPEKIEAAIGLCKMKYWNTRDDKKLKHAHMPDYQPEVAVYFVGKALSEFISEYKRDYENFGPGKGRERVPARIPFRADAKRFEAALIDLSNNAKGSSAKALAEELKQKATPILKGIYNYQINLGDDQQFRDTFVTAKLRPKTGYVFKTLKLPEVPLD
jgi:hypothetical protein